MIPAINLGYHEKQANDHSSMIDLIFAKSYIDCRV